MSAARHADVLFVKEKPGGDNDLAAFCRRESIPHILFEDFSHALRSVSAIVEGKKTAKEALAEGKAGRGGLGDSPAPVGGEDRAWRGGVEGSS